MRDHSKHIEVSREEAVARLLGVASFEPAVETIALDAAAVGRVLAVDAVAQLDMPNCLTCKMDSVAVHWAGFAEGMPDTSGWQRGVQWEFANTGIGMPEGYDTAVVIENVVLDEATSEISFIEAPSCQYAGTTPAGSKMKAGDVLVSAGTTLTPLLISHIASGNNAQVQVYARPKVAFIPTGNELVKPGGEVPRGKNIETNSLLAAAKIAAWGGDCKVWDIVPDDQEAIKRAVCDAVAQCDIVVLNAGSSKGSDDWNIEMLEEAGEVLYHETNHGPGHHSSGSVVDGKPVVGISGPPGGAAFTMDFYLYPMIRAYFGQPTDLQKVDVRLRSAFPRSTMRAKTPKAQPKGEERPSVVADGRAFYGIKQLALCVEDGEVWATPAASTHVGPVEGDAMDCYYALESGAEPPAAGDVIAVDLKPE